MDNDVNFINALDSEIKNINSDDKTIKFLLAATTYYKQKYKNHADELIINRIKDAIIMYSNDPSLYEENEDSPEITTAIDVKTFAGGSMEKFELVLQRLQSEQNESTKSFFNDLRHNTTLYKNLREHANEFIIQKHLNSFVNLAQKVLEVYSDIKINDVESYKLHYEKLNKKLLSEILASRTIKLYLHLMEHKLNFELSEPYSIISEFNTYCALKKYAANTNINFKLDEELGIF